MKTTIPQLRNSINHSLVRAFLLIAPTLGWLALSPQARAVCQDACLTNSNTVQGEDALFSNTTGGFNTANGNQALQSNATGSNNTANGEAEPPDFCRRTAQDVLTSCGKAAQSDYSLALAKCDNLADPATQARCRNQASADLNDARQTCQEQNDARLAACERLGEAPYDPVIDPSNFVARVDNPYFPLTPGTTFIYEGQTAEGFEHDEFAVTGNTRVILGVTCVEVHDTVTTNGELTEDTLDWFAQDRNGNVWYFGENTQELENGLITTIEGTWMAGFNGDKPGIVMKAHPAIGDFYRQEFSLANAEDFAETLSLTEHVTVPAGSFNHCLKSQETTPLETDLLEYKFYAPGVGNVLEVDARTGDRVELVRIRRGGR